MVNAAADPSQPNLSNSSTQPQRLSSLASQLQGNSSNSSIPSQTPTFDSPKNDLTNKPSFNWKKFRLLGAVAVLLLLVVGSFAAYFLLQSNTDLRQQASCSNVWTVACSGGNTYDGDCGTPGVFGGDQNKWCTEACSSIGQTVSSCSTKDIGGGSNNNPGGSSNNNSTCAPYLPTASACHGVGVNNRCNGFAGTCVRNGDIDSQGYSVCGCVADEGSLANGDYCETNESCASGKCENRRCVEDNSSGSNSNELDEYCTFAGDVKCVNGREYKCSTPGTKYRLTEIECQNTSPTVTCCTNGSESQKSIQACTDGGGTVGVCPTQTGNCTSAIGEIENGETRYGACSNKRRTVFTCANGQLTTTGQDCGKLVSDLCTDNSECITNNCTLVQGLDRKVCGTAVGGNTCSVPDNQGILETGKSLAGRCGVGSCNANQRIIYQCTANGLQTNCASAAQSNCNPTGPVENPVSGGGGACAQNVDFDTGTFSGDTGLLCNCAPNQLCTALNAQGQAITPRVFPGYEIPGQDLVAFSFQQNCYEAPPTASFRCTDNPNWNPTETSGGEGAACSPGQRTACGQDGCGSNSQRICQGSTLGACVVTDACAPALTPGMSCQGLDRFSGGEPSLGNFVGCNGSLNCFCADFTANSTVQCYEDTFNDSCGAPGNPNPGNPGTNPGGTTYQCNSVCTGEGQCADGLACVNANDGNFRCRVPENPNDSNCNPPATSTPPPAIGPMCISLTKDVAEPRVGSRVTFTCAEVTGADSYRFRAQLVGSFVRDLAPTSPGANTTVATIPEPGQYYVQCAPCANGVCQEFEPLPGNTTQTNTAPSGGSNTPSSAMNAAGAENTNNNNLDQIEEITSQRRTPNFFDRVMNLF